MAFVVSFSFSMPLHVSKTLYKEINPTRLAFGRLKGRATGKTAIRLLAANQSSRGVSLVDWSCDRQQTEADRCLGESDSGHSHISLSTCCLISGFWVGPDIEDGWGFIEAYVN
ncbi:hypothetical protein NMG60_11020763 [Bertholletia excelsa]